MVLFVPILLDNRTVESTVTSIMKIRVYKERCYKWQNYQKICEDTRFKCKDYGAVGDGIHDDRQAIQDAIDAAAQGLEWKMYIFPEGTLI